MNRWLGDGMVRSKDGRREGQGECIDKLVNRLRLEGWRDE